MVTVIDAVVAPVLHRKLKLPLPPEPLAVRIAEPPAQNSVEDGETLAVTVGHVTAAGTRMEFETGAQLVPVSVTVTV